MPSLSPDTIATIFTGGGVLFGVWRLIEGVRRDLTNQISSVRSDLTNQIGSVRSDLVDHVGSLNHRIDSVLLAERRHER